MKADEGATPDEGGEAPCFAHLLQAAPPVDTAFLAHLVDELADGVVVADADGTIIYWNAAATRIFGWDADDAVGRSLDVIIPERLRARHWAGYHQVMATGRTSYGDRLLEVPALHRDERDLSIAFTVTLVHRPDEALPCAIAAVIRDDTEGWQQRRRTAKELAALKAAAPPASG